MYRLSRKIKVYTMLKKLFVLSLFFSIAELKVFAAIETIATGSFIINMGVTPQTIANGLKPYGLVYDLTKNYQVPVKWVISQTKVKDGIDFSHNGIDYKGGPFIIPAEYRTAAVNARITYWQGLGVVGATTVAPLMVDVYLTLKNAPRWTLDDQNGGIAEDFLKNASIPVTGYDWVAPAALTCCNDIFVMPHADPKWPTHGHLYDWNLDCDGAIWLGCHAGSAQEDLFNPSNKPQQMNFLSNKTGNAVGAGPYEENALVLWGNHSDGTPPYSYAYPNDPIMQFMGIIDAATQNGSEQIYLPKTSWRPSTKIYVWDPTHLDVPAKSPGPAAVLASGRAFGDPLRGRVMLEASHSIAKASAPANVAAQRAFFNFSYLVMSEKAVIPNLSNLPDTMYSGQAYTFSFSFPPGIDSSGYTILWSSSCGGTFSSANTKSTTFTPPALPFPSSCVITVKITDACGRVNFNAKAITTGCKLTVTGTGNGPSCGGSNGSIVLNVMNGTAPYSYNWSRVSPVGTGSGTGTTISGLAVGTYNITVTSTGGCTSTLTVNLTQAPALTVTGITTNVACNGASTGAITTNVTGGTPGYTYLWNGGATSPNRINIPVGTYTVTVTDANSCTASYSATITQPVAISLSLNPTNVKCFGEATGAVNSIVSGGISPYTYVWSNGSSTANITNVTAGTYSVTVTDANGCSKTSNATVSQPASALSLSSTMINPTCGLNNGSIDLSVSGGTPAYTYAWSTGSTNQDISNLASGTYTVTVTDANSCTEVLTKIIVANSTMSLSFTKTDATCPNIADGSINLTVTGGNGPYTYDWDNDGLEFPDNDPQDLTNLLPGVYKVIVTDSDGCTAMITVTILAINSLPSQPSGINH